MGEPELEPEEEQEEEEELIEVDTGTPLARLPQTSEASQLGLYLLGLILMAAGFFIRRKKSNQA